MFAVILGDQQKVRKVDDAAGIVIEVAVCPVFAGFAVVLGDHQQVREIDDAIQIAIAGKCVLHVNLIGGGGCSHVGVSVGVTYRIKAGVGGGVAADDAGAGPFIGGISGGEVLSERRHGILAGREVDRQDIVGDVQD